MDHYHFVNYKKHFIIDFLKPLQGYLIVLKFMRIDYLRTNLVKEQ
jgi:hypothetical protein